MQQGQGTGRKAVLWFGRAIRTHRHSELVHMDTGQGAGGRGVEGGEDVGRRYLRDTWWNLREAVARLD